MITEVKFLEGVPLPDGGDVVTVIRPRAGITIDAVDSGIWIRQGARITAVPMANVRYYLADGMRLASEPEPTKTGGPFKTKR